MCQCNLGIGQAWCERSTEYSLRWYRKWQELPKHYSGPNAEIERHFECLIPRIVDTPLEYRSIKSKRIIREPG